MESWELKRNNRTTEASVGEGEENSLDDACSSVALRVDPLDDDALRFMDSLRLFFVLLDVSQRRQKE